MVKESPAKNNSSSSSRTHLMILQYLAVFLAMICGILNTTNRSSIPNYSASCDYLARFYTFCFTLAKWLCFRFAAVKGTIMVDQLDTELFSSRLRTILRFQTNVLLILVVIFTIMATGSAYTDGCIINLDRSVLGSIASYIFLAAYTVIEAITNVLLLMLFLKPLMSNQSDLVSQRLMKTGKFNLYAGGIVIGITTSSMILITIFNLPFSHSVKIYGLFFSAITELDLASNCIYHFLSLRYVWARNAEAEKSKSGKPKNMVVLSQHSKNNNEDDALSKTLLSEN